VAPLLPLPLTTRSLCLHPHSVTHSSCPQLNWHSVRRLGFGCDHLSKLLSALLARRGVGPLAGQSFSAAPPHYPFVPIDALKEVGGRAGAQ
jgi:hypothetical protein